MASTVLDTSVLVRYLTNDDPSRAEAARSYFATAPEGSLLLPDVALAELTFVLLRVYRWPVAAVADAVRSVSGHRAIQVPGKETWLAVADDIEQGRGPVDCYLGRTAEREGIPTVLTFDEGMWLPAGIRSVSP